MTETADCGADEATGLMLLAGLISTLAALLGLALFPDIEIALMVLRIWMASLSMFAGIIVLTQLLNSWLAAILVIFGVCYGAVMLRIPEAAFVVYLGIPTFIAMQRQRLQLPKHSLLAAAIAAMAIIGASGAQTTFNMVLRLHAGEVHVDTLYHSALSAMLKSYGVVSIGVDGLVATEYHVFSHAIFAAISTITGVGVIETYGIATSVLFAPLLICAITYATRSLPMPFVQDRPPSLVFATVTATLLLVILPAWYWKRAFWGSYFVSESYLVALIVMMAALPVMWLPKLKARDWVLIAVATCMCALSKPSVAAIMFGLMLVRILFVTRGARSLLELTGFTALGVMLLMLQLSNVDTNQHYLAFKEFDFPLKYGRTASAYRAFTESSGIETVYTSMRLVLAFGGFYFAHFVISWAALFILFRYQKAASSLLHLPTLYVIAATIVGLLMTVLLAIPGGSLYYFTNVAMFIGLPVVVCGLWQIGLRFLMPQSGLLLLASLICVGVVVSGAILKKHQIIDQETVPNALIIRLLDLRKTDRNSVFVTRDSDALRGQLPLDEPRKTGLAFSAISERAWYGMIDPGLECAYAYHGYQSHKSLEKLDSESCHASQIVPSSAVMFPSGR